LSPETVTRFPVLDELNTVIPEVPEAVPLGIVTTVEPPPAFGNVSVIAVVSKVASPT
jgi:hypothetical protein